MTYFPSGLHGKAQTPDQTSAGSGWLRDNKPRCSFKLTDSTFAIFFFSSRGNLTREHRTIIIMLITRSKERKSRASLDKESGIQEFPWRPSLIEFPETDSGMQSCIQQVSWGGLLRDTSAKKWGTGSGEADPPRRLQLGPQLILQGDLERNLGEVKLFRTVPN